MKVLRDFVSTFAKHSCEINLAVDDTSTLFLFHEIVHQFPIVSNTSADFARYSERFHHIVILLCESFDAQTMSMRKMKSS